MAQIGFEFVIDLLVSLLVYCMFDYSYFHVSC